ncbi:alanine/glycine:cation symporter family protein [Luminiphilus sp. nBUS_07]|uniref:alanine/glycine:cation symporter family protein n=1 Tax=Luminiphilus sp. nBUS_07 TaxID=3395314 RepID=UPI003EBEA3AC
MADLGIDATVEALLAPVASAVSGFVFYAVPIGDNELPLIVLWLAAAAVYFTVYLRFINFRALWLALRHVRGDFSDPEAKGEISHFKAVATAVSGTVGVGNIGGVAVAISLGGPGAAFWLLVAGVLSMSTKLVECTLGVKYRRHNPDGSVSGGPMYYLEHWFQHRQWPRLGRFMGGFYALALVIAGFGIGNMFQANQAYTQFLVITGGDASWLSDRGWFFGLALAVVVALVVIGGIRSIAKVTVVLVPFMASLYIVSALIVIGLSAEHIPAALQSVMQGAFTREGATGGALGAMVIGFQRALFSNEAGLGSASIAHSAVQTDEPASEGITALLEPFIDTVIILSLSSLVILTSAIPNNLMGSEVAGIELTSAAFAVHFDFAPYVIAVAALLFAFSSLLAWSYYGLKGWTYLFGESRAGQLCFQLLFCGFIVVGCMLQLAAVLDFSDAMIFVIAIPNLIALYLFAPEVKTDITKYIQKLRADGRY